MSFSESPHFFRISTVCSPHFGAGPQISPIPIQTHSCQGLRFHLPLLQQYHLPRIHKRTVAPATALSFLTHIIRWINTVLLYPGTQTQCFSLHFLDVLPPELPPTELHLQRFRWPPQKYLLFHPDLSRFPDP